MSFASGKRALAVCERCGKDCKYTELREEFVKGKGQGNQVCPECYDKDHPQNWYGTQRVVDFEAIEAPAPEDFEQVRSLFGFAPVGAPANRLVLRSGKVSVLL